ncbi:MAG: hypothetical protein AVDCRST_MAG85-85 [uncultured Solirubrobacteraceae bacterium]|uniref:Uncharacterized protein n=1 Tax=uncultured Solirubrobacteraceae bacterium TaxID=1162706 RepID=A0A6J4RG94_9ACTN|nr:MAG: hypothetical protein AVDCRST_MAG85-85 [uncultured Solirubrobacteraceae bacterium]
MDIVVGAGQPQAGIGRACSTTSTGRWCWRCRPCWRSQPLAHRRAGRVGAHLRARRRTTAPEGRARRAARRRAGPGLGDRLGTAVAVAVAERAQGVEGAVGQRLAQDALAPRGRRDLAAHAGRVLDEEDVLGVLLVQRDELLELLARDARAVLDDDAPVLLRVDDLPGRRRRLPGVVAVLGPRERVRAVRRRVRRVRDGVVGVVVDPERVRVADALRVRAADRFAEVGHDALGDRPRPDLRRPGIGRRRAEHQGRDEDHREQRRDAAGQPHPPPLRRRASRAALSGESFLAYGLLALLPRAHRRHGKERR